MGKGRRSNNEGSVYQRADKTWAAVVSLPNGKRKWLYGKTRKAVVDKLKKFQQDQAAGLNVTSENLTVEQLLTAWLEQIVKRTNRVRVYELYAMIARVHINPRIGRIHVAKLTTAQVQSILNDLDDAGKALYTIRNVRAVLRRALNYAVRQGMVSRNVAGLTELPKVEDMEDEDSTKQIIFLTPQQALDLLAVVKGHRWEVLYRLALELGLRRGELLALRIEDIDLTHRLLRVTGTMHRGGGKIYRNAPKTESSRRTLPLSDRLVEALREHIAKLEAYKAQRIAIDDWVETGLLFPSERGTPIEPTNLYRHFKNVAKKAGLPDAIRFHDLRHSCASFLIAQGIHPRVVMEILGHSEIGTTMNIYGHVLPEVQAAALTGVSEQLDDRRRIDHILYERYDADGTPQDTDAVATEDELAFVARHSPQGWRLKAVLVYKDGHQEERWLTCGKPEEPGQERQRAAD